LLKEALLGPELAATRPWEHFFPFEANPAALSEVRSKGLPGISKLWACSFAIS
jgi:hypothetical protein